MKSIAFERSNGDLTLSRADSKLVHRARSVGLWAAYLAFAFALTIPASLLLQYPILRASLPNLKGAHWIGAAFSFLLPISVIILYGNSGIRWGKVIWYLILGCSGIVILEYLTPNELPFADFIRLLDPVENPDKIAPNSALCLFFSSLAALLIASPDERKRRFGQFVALVPAVVAALAIIGHAYSIKSLYGMRGLFGVGDYSQMPVVGATRYLLLSLSLLCVHPAEGLMRILVTDSPAGVMSRRLYAAAILVPPVLGLFALVSSGSWGWYDISFGIVLFVMAGILLFASVVAVTSRRLERADIFRLRAEYDLRATGEQLRELSAHIQDMQEEERVRIAREVHDELGQSLTALKMDVSMLRKQLPEIANDRSSAEETDRRLVGMLDLVNGTIRTVQRISSELRPSVLDDLGLSAAIEWQAREFEKRSAIRCALDLPAKDLGLSTPQTTAIFRIFQETLTNVARHAGARKIEVELRRVDDRSAGGNGQIRRTVLLRVHDDGIGLGHFEAHGQSVTNGQLGTTGSSNGRNSGLGLIGMRERAALAGGVLEIQSAPGEGTTVTVTMPAA
jgi:signal transduction histidine kinase